MANPKGILAFTEDGYFLDRANDYSLMNLPEQLTTELALTKKYTIYCMTFGEGGDFVCTWKAKGHIRSKDRILHSLENYPKLEEYIVDISSAKDIELSTFHVSLGPNGSFYINSNRGQYQMGLDGRLDQEVTERLSDDKYVRDPVNVALGVDGSYVLVGTKGDIMWDLKGQYGSLDEELQNAKFGVRNVALSPFDAAYYYVMFSNGESRFGADPDWSLAV